MQRRLVLIGAGLIAISLSAQQPPGPTPAREATTGRYIFGW